MKHVVHIVLHINLYLTHEGLSYSHETIVYQDERQSSTIILFSLLYRHVDLC